VKDISRGLFCTISISYSCLDEKMLKAKQKNKIKTVIIIFWVNKSRLITKCYRRWMRSVKVKARTYDKLWKQYLQRDFFFIPSFPSCFSPRLDFFHCNKYLFHHVFSNVSLSQSCECLKLAKNKNAWIFLHIFNFEGFASNKYTIYRLAERTILIFVTMVDTRASIVNNS
jgi:hypothetical protein